MKTKEELNALKEEVETVRKKLNQLTDEELAQVAGGDIPCGRTQFFPPPPGGKCFYPKIGRCPCPDSYCSMR